MPLISVSGGGDINPEAKAKRSNTKPREPDPEEAGMEVDSDAEDEDLVGGFEVVNDPNNKPDKETSKSNGGPNAAKQAERKDNRALKVEAISKKSEGFTLLGKEDGSFNVVAPGAASNSSAERFTTAAADARDAVPTASGGPPRPVPVAVQVD